MAFEFRSLEQSNFSKLMQSHLNNPDAPLLLEGATGLGKTRAYLYPIFQAAREGKRVAIILPTRQLIEQLLNSADMKICNIDGAEVRAFIPRRYFDNASDHREHRTSAVNAPVMLCSSASVIIDQRLCGDYNGVTKRDYLLFDEADQLPDVAALQADVSVHYQTLKDQGIKPITAKQAADELLAKRYVEPEDRAAAKIILESIDNPFWFNVTGLDDDGSIRLYHKLPGRLLKRISNRPNTAFISATLSISGKFDNFQRAMGITTVSRHSSAIDPSHHGTLSFAIRDSEAVNSPQWLNTVLCEIADAAKPCLVVTPSYDLSRSLADQYPDAIVRNQDEEETASQAASRLLQDDSKDTLIATAAWAGLDTPAIWKSIIVPRIPFPPPVIIDDNVESHYIGARNSAVRRMRQVIGRGLRSPDADCDIVICDSRWKKVEAFVPTRFQQAWQSKTYAEGAEIKVVLSTNERSTYLRKLAIKKYGLLCKACAWIPKSPNQIEIHHLDPIAEGIRQTTLDDVIPLCANCHRLAHSERPPLSVAQIKSML